MARAMSSLPVPLSPVMRTEARVGATLSISWKMRCIAALWPIISKRCSCCSVTRASSRWALAACRTLRTLTSTRSRTSGFSKKSLAPSLIALTASFTVAWPLMTMTGRSLVASSPRTRASASSPLICGSLTSKIARSTGVSGLARIASACSAVSAPSTR